MYKQLIKLLLKRIMREDKVDECVLLLSYRRGSKFPASMRAGDTPVPIPNTTVKTWAADGTALETVWESRWAPDQKENNRLEA